MIPLINLLKSGSCFLLHLDAAERIIDVFSPGNIQPPPGIKGQRYVNYFPDEIVRHITACLEATPAGIAKGTCIAVGENKEYWEVQVNKITSLNHGASVVLAMQRNQTAAAQSGLTKLVQATKQLSQAGKEKYSMICESLLDLSGAKYALVNRIEGNQVSVEAISGHRMTLEKASKLLGVNLHNSSWQWSGSNGEAATQYPSITKWVGKYFPNPLVSALEAIYNTGPVVVINVLDAAQLVLIYEAGSHLENREIIEVFSSHVKTLLQSLPNGPWPLSGEHTSKLVTNIPGIMYRFHLVDQQLSLQFISDELTRMTGHCSKDQLAKTLNAFHEYVFPADRGGISEQIIAAVRQGSTYQLSYRLQCANGEYIPVKDLGRVSFDPQGQLHSIDGIIIPWTAESVSLGLSNPGIPKREATSLDKGQGERLQLKFMQLANNASKLVQTSCNSLSESIADVFNLVAKNLMVERCYLCTEKDGRFIVSNQWHAEGLAAQCGLELSNLKWLDRQLNRNYFAFSKPEDISDGGRVIDFLPFKDTKTALYVPIRLADLRGFWGFEFVSREHNWVEEEIYLLRTITNTLTIALDRSLLKARGDSQPAAEAKRAFLAAISHEIRTPLTAVMGMSQLLSETSLSHQQEQYVQSLRWAGDNLFSLLNNVLDLYRIECGEFQLDTATFNLWDLVEEVNSFLAPNAKAKGLSLLCTLHPQTPEWVVGDPDRLRQVLINLIGNGIKFTSNGEVVAEVKPGSSGQLRFQVTDTGIGIVPEKQEEIFTPFTQTDPSITRNHGGTGLGLPISKHLVRKMGGNLKVSSTVGKGSTFYFDISLRISSAPEEREQLKYKDCTLASKGYSKKYSILLVEDCPDNVLLVKAYLSQSEFDVTSVTNGQEAVARFQEQKFDLILMDMEMPVMDGYTATRHMRQWEKSQVLETTPILAFTAYTFKDDIGRCLAAGCDAHLGKPIRKQKLLSTLQSFVSHKIDQIDP